MIKHRFSQIFIDNNWGEAAADQFRMRRQALLQTINEPIILWGVPHRIGYPYPWAVVNAPVFQDPFILYLTGINQPGIALALEPGPNGTWRDILFVPKKDSNAEFWEGAHLGYEPKTSHSAIKVLTGFSDVLPMNQIKQWVSQASRSSHKINSFWVGKPSLPIQKMIRWGRQSGFSVESIGSVRWSQALMFDQQDMQNLRVAHHKTAQIFNAVVAALPDSKTERDIHRVMISEICRATEQGASFSPIIASGANAATLHYTKNNDAFDMGELLLLDFGIRDPLIVTDVTRTIPISGKFNPLQRLLYEIVLETQQGVERQVKAGISIQQLNDWCWHQIETLLTQRFYKRGGKAKMAYAAHKPHFVSHLIGYAVHDGDPSRDYRHQPLAPGMIISNEPGLYGEFEMEWDGKRFCEVIGIRIEDDLLVGKTGCENLSRLIPKSVQDIESVVTAAWQHRNKGDRHE